MPAKTPGSYKSLPSKKIGHKSTSSVKGTPSCKIEKAGGAAAPMASRSQRGPAKKSY